LPLLLQLRLLALLLAAKPLTLLLTPVTRWQLTLHQSLMKQLLLLKKALTLQATLLKALQMQQVKLPTLVQKLLAMRLTLSPMLLKMQLPRQKQWLKASNSLKTTGFTLVKEKAVPGNAGAAFFFGWS
jgi:hypothetical protein